MHIRFLSAALLLSARAILACQCGHRPTALEALPEATAVFDGTVVARTPFLAHVYDYLVVLERTDFVVHQAWRGPNQTGFTVVGAFSNCDVLFQVGSRYLVFARPFNNPALGLGSSICLPTGPYSLSQSALRDLGPGLSFNPSYSSSAESAFRRFRRIAYTSFLYGVATSAALVSGQGSAETRWRAWAPLAPFVALLGAGTSSLLLLRRRFRLLLGLLPLLLVIVLLSIALQGFLTIQFEPQLSHWFLGTSYGA